MKKLSLLIASIVVLLTVGIFTSQAVSNNAGSFNNLNFDFGRYVQDDVYKYKCDKTTYTCNKVKVSSLSTSTLSGLYDTESECKSNCKKVTGSSSYTEYTGGVNTDWWSNNDDDEEEATPGYSYTDTAIGNGLSGWDLSFGGDEDDNNNSNVTQFSNPTSKLGFDLFDWGNKDKEDPITSVNTDVATNPFSNSFDFTKGDSVDPAETKQSTNIFTNLLKTLGFGEKEMEFDNAPLDDEEMPETDDEENGDIVFSVSPEKTYTKGESIKVKISKQPKEPKGHDFFFWYDLKVDRKGTPEDKSDDILKGSNAITKSEFEIPTKDYYRIELTLKASTRGPYPKYEYKEYTSETVVLTLDEEKKTKTGDIANDCYLEITKLNPNTNRLTSENAKDVEVKFKLHCTSYNKEKFDVKPLSVSAYIDVPWLDTIGKDIFQCDTQKFDGKTVYKEGTEYTVTCSKDVVEQALTKEGENDTRTRYLMVDMYYNTNKKTGHNYGEEYIDRFTSTRNRVIGTTTGDGGNENNRTMGIEAIVNPGANRTFATCEGGKVTIKWSSNGYDKCSISSEKMLYIQGEGKEGSKEFSVYKNLSNEPAHYTIKLECSYAEGEKTKTDEKSVQINVPKCGGNQPPQNGDETIQEKCNKTKCNTTYGLGKQIILKQVDGKIVNASNLKFNVNIGGDTCDLDVFQKTFARIVIDGKIIQDITIPNTKEREFTFGNIWEQLSETTRNNISDTLIEHDYDGAPVNFTLESWSTFDETKGKTWNCNWNRESRKVLFILDKREEKDTNNSTKPEDDNSEGADGFEVTRNDILAACEKVNENSSPENIENLNNLISNFEGAGLDLDDLKSINEDVAQALSNFKGEFFNLSGLKSINKNVAQALSNFKRYYLALDGLTSINEDVAQALSNFKGDYLHLHGLTSINEDVAQALCPIKNKIFSNDNVEKTLEDICKDTPTGNTSSILEIKLVGNNIIKAGDSYEVKITKFNNIPEGSYCWWDNRSETNEEIGMSIKNNKMNVGQQETFDKSNNKYDNVSLICDVNGKEIKSNTIILKTVLTVKFTCIGCEQCKSFSAIPTWRKDRSKEKEIILSSNPKHYEVELPAGRVKDWTLRFLDCEPTPKIIKNDYNWKVFGGVNLQPPDIMGTFIKDISIGSKNLGTVEIEIKK